MAVTEAIERLQTTAKYPLAGFVEDEEGNPLDGVTVTLGSESRTTGKNGQYSFDDKAAGTYTLTFSKDGYIPVDPADGKLTVTLPGEIQVVVLKKAEEPVQKYSFSGYVFDEEGTPITDVEVTIIEQLNSGYIITRTLTEDDGHYSYSNVKQGTYILKFHKDGYSPVGLSGENKDEMTVVIPDDIGKIRDVIMKADEEEDHGSVLYEGQCGNSLYWRLYEDGLLEIYGKGDMWDYEEQTWSSSAPWFTYYSKRSVEEILLRKGVTRIGMKPFLDVTM